MPQLLEAQTAINYLQQYLSFNKARGMVSECSLESFVINQVPTHANKYLSGGWLISPKTVESSRYRFVVFVMPHLYNDEIELEYAINEKQADRAFQGLATYLTQSAIGVIVSGATIRESNDLFELEENSLNLRWTNFSYTNERLNRNVNNEPFTKWAGNRGRASRGNEWQPDVIRRFEELDGEQLTSLTLRQAFYNSYLKKELKKPLDDPYDVDAFIVSYRGAVMPVEIKEKSPTESGAFGLDAGRILMMLRMCLATDSNAIYIVREIDNSVERDFVAWRYITLSNLILGCSWNLQAGGAGMGGGATQTVMMPGSLFENFTERNLTEEWLEQNASLQESVRVKAAELAIGLEAFL